MNFRKGDAVMHWSYGLGKIVRLEERELSGAKSLFYAVQIGDMTVWVPADDTVGTRLRPPTPKAKFKALLQILNAPGEPLPDDRRERRVVLAELIKDGKAESLCRLIRNLTVYHKTHPLNDNDQAFLRQAQAALSAEWGFAWSLTPAQALVELQQLLSAKHPQGAK